MTFHLTPDRLAALSQIEAESNCTIAAGVELYQHSQSPDAATSNADTESQLSALTALVAAHWGTVLDPDSVTAIAADVQTYLNTQVNQRLHGEPMQ